MAIKAKINSLGLGMVGLPMKGVKTEIDPGTSIQKTSTLRHAWTRLDRLFRIWIKSKANGC